MVQSNNPSPAGGSAKFDDSGDNEDLQALFDSIAAKSVAPVAPPMNPVAMEDVSGDSLELQALFDSIVDQPGSAVPASVSGAGVAAQATSSPEVASAVTCASASESSTAGQDAHPAQVFNRLGNMTRELHDTLRELGYERALEDAAKAIPDARQRLAYIVQMTEQAASRVLNATEIAKPIQDGLRDQSQALAGRWDKVFANQLSPADFKALAADTHPFFHDVPDQVAATNAQLTEIMMAQDFQDLTGQVVRKVVELAQKLEQQLLSVLLESAPPEMRVEAPEGLLNGPVVNAEGRTDVVHSQAQVDDLLESLGF